VVSDSAERGEDVERARRRARIFGEVLPEVTGDERGPSRADGDSGKTERGDEQERWLRDNVPPHHGS
jgi:hypothetical protein